MTPTAPDPNPDRCGGVIRVRPERFEDYRREHASGRPEVSAIRAPGEWWARREEVFHLD